MKKENLLYEGKAKSVFTTEDNDKLILYFKNDTSAFDGVKKTQLDRKGLVNNKFNAFIMQKLEDAGIKTHFIEILSEQESIVKRLDMLPIECVVRNIAAGSICKRLGTEQGIDLDPPIFEFFLKNDELHDPMINESHILGFGWATLAQINEMKRVTLEVNNILKALFLNQTSYLSTIN